MFPLGVFSYLRLVQTSIEDMVYSAGSFRIRQYFLSLDPAAVPFFPPTDPQDDEAGAHGRGGDRSAADAAHGSQHGRVQQRDPGGVAMALALRSLLEASISVAAVTGALVALGLAALCFAYQARRFSRAAAVVPELHEGQSPDMPGWPTACPA